MVHFSESYVGGFFGFGRTYGAVARFECASVPAFEVDWPVALYETARWRATRKRRATVLHLDFQVPVALVWEAVAFAAAKVLVPPASLAPELRGLGVYVGVYTPDAEHYLHLFLFPEATGEPARVYQG
jgi:hypothetical protein